MRSNTVNYNHIVHNNTMLLVGGPSARCQTRRAYNYGEKHALLYGLLYEDAASGGLQTHHIVNRPMWLYLQCEPWTP
jgi:hypothetical protein